MNSLPLRLLATSAVLFVLAACGGDGPTKTQPVASVTVTAPAGTITAGQTYQFSFTAKDASGAALSGRAVSWTSSSGSVATISATGLLTAVSPGGTTVRATSEGQSGSVQVTVAPAPVASVEVTAASATMYASDQQQLTLVLRDAKGGALGSRPTTWTSSSNGVAVVSTSGLVTAISVGQATITARSEGVSGTLTLTVQPMPAPQVTSTATTVIQSGGSAVINGMFFSQDLFGNTVTINGEAAPVTAATRTQLTVTVPCLPTGAATLRVTRNGLQSNTVQVSTAAPQLQLAPGESMVVGTSNCVELPLTDATNRFLVTLSNSATSEGILAGAKLLGNPASAGVTVAHVRMPAVPAAMAALHDAEAAKQAKFDQAHLDHMKRTGALFEQARRASGARAESRSGMRMTSAPDVGDTRSFFFSYNHSGCAGNVPTMQVKALHVGTYAVIWEDQSNPLLSAAHADLAAFYERIVQIYDQDQHESIKENFGDPLRRDAALDNDGKIHMVFTHRLNNTNAAAYVHPCDQYPNGTQTQSGPMTGSNFGEVFYAHVPETSGSNPGNGNYPDGWFSFMMRTIVHEVKHIASISARMANNAPGEEQWLEEGTARMAEEMWIRKSLHDVPWKGNTGWGTAADNGVYCDFHPSDATCNAADPLRRPSYGMRRHFNEIRPQLEQPWNYSPFGNVVGQLSGTFYNSTWSLVRYTMDRYATSESAFLKSLINSQSTGVANLTAAAGVSFADLLAGWGLALYSDDYPGMPSTNLNAQFQTWNLRSIYAGLNASPSWSGNFPRAFPIEPAQAAFGSFESENVTIRGGATAYFELSGNSTAPQLLRLRSSTGGAVSPNIRMTVLRLQ